MWKFLIMWQVTKRRQKIDLLFLQLCKDVCTYGCRLEMEEGDKNVVFLRLELCMVFAFYKSYIVAIII